MLKKFYTLGATFAKKWYWGQIVDKDIALVDKCIGDGMRSFRGTVHIRIVKGTTPGDFLWAGFPLKMVSSKVLEVWKAFGRFTTYTIVIEDNVSPIEYTGVAFLGRGGPFDPVKSKAVYSKSLNDEGKPALMKHEGMYFDDSQWDGSDLFTIDEFPCVPIVTARVVRAMKGAKVTNCRYTALERYGIW